MNQDMQRMQNVEQSLHAITAQRSAYQAQLLEIENATRELAHAKESYRIISNIMVKQDSAKLKAELEDKKASIQARAGAIEKQEQRLRQEMQNLQESILKGGNA